jgi:hypothetical protein
LVYIYRPHLESDFGILSLNMLIYYARPEVTLYLIINYERQPDSLRRLRGRVKQQTAECWAVSRNPQSGPQFSHRHQFRRGSYIPVRANAAALNRVC